MIDSEEDVCYAWRKQTYTKLERMKELCKERNDLYDKQNDSKGQKQKIEMSLER